MTKPTQPMERRARRPTLGRAGAVLAIVLALAACSSEEPNPLGRDLVGDVLGSRPGVVFQDTLDVLADTVLAYNSLISTGSRLDLGRENGYEYVMIVRPSMARASADTQRTVTSAELRIVMVEDQQQMRARFYKLGAPYSEGDSMAVLDTTGVILDETGSAERIIDPSDALYWLPPDLAQGWIRGDSANNGIAIVYSDPVDDRHVRFASRSDTDDRATLQLAFSDTTTKTYNIAHDATYIRPTTTTSNLIVSDGYVRRIYFRLDLDALPDSAAVHAARVRLHLVDGTVEVGINPTVVLFTPQSDDPTSSSFLKEQLVTSVSVDDTKDVLEMAVTNALLLILEGQIADNGFVLRFGSENTELRHVEFYGTQAADSLRPRAYVTASTPAEFQR